MGVGTAQNPQKSPVNSAAESPRSGIVWLASYPKSGNTWTRAFLHNLVHATSGQTQAQQINELNQFSMTSAAKSLFNEILGFVPTDEHLDRIAGGARARPAASCRSRRRADFRQNPSGAGCRPRTHQHQLRRDGRGDLHRAQPARCCDFLCTSPYQADRCHNRPYEPE